MTQAIKREPSRDTAVGTVVVVEDNSEMQALLRDFLTSQGYEVRCFWSGPQAIEFFSQSTTPVRTLVVVDLVLPGASGLEFVQQLKQAFPQVPSIVISAFGTKRTPHEAARAGAAGYLTKPFRLSQLESMIQQIWNEAGKE